MNLFNSRLITEQVSGLIRAIEQGKKAIIPPAGWIHSVRSGLGMSMRQLGQRANVSTNVVSDWEQREQRDAITVATLKKAAEAMDMELVYYFKPKKNSIEQTLENRARLKAKEILKRSNNTMTLEAQSTGKESQELELERLTKDILNKMPSNLWD